MVQGSKESLDTNPSSKREGKVNRIAEGVDQGLLLRFPEDQGLWVGEGGDPCSLVAPTMVVNIVHLEQLEEEEGKGYL
jgi:hypothetical protein